MDERLRKQSWYLGEVSQEAATSILKATDLPNAYVVYSSPDNSAKYTLSTKTQIIGSQDAISIKHLRITSPQEGMYQLPGCDKMFSDIIELVANYVTSCNPPLSPALRGRTNFEMEFSASGKPPEYNRVNTELKPEIASLPNITSVKVDKVTEAKQGYISPTSSLLRNSRYDPLWYNRGGEGVIRRDGVSNSRRNHVLVDQWHRYQEHHWCHPKNICYGCWYRPHYEEYSNYQHAYGTIVSGTDYYPYAWYNPRESGCLRVLSLLLFYLLCCPCFFLYCVVCLCCKDESYATSLDEE